MSIKKQIEEITAAYNKLEVEKSVLKDKYKNLPTKFLHWVIAKGYTYNPVISNSPKRVFTHNFKQNETIESLYTQFNLENE